MLTVSTELQPILNGVVQFISYMVLAVFAENVILARALGVTRLMKLVPDHRAQVWDFCLPLLLVITLSAPAGWAAHDLFFPWLRDYLPAWLPISALRPIVYLTCGIAAMAVAWLLLGVLPRKLRASCRSQLSLATCSTAVLGTMLICANQNYTILQSVAFSLGSGLGYVFAVFIVREGRRRLRSKAISSIFQGLPSSMIYIGVLSLAIYALVGHTVVRGSLLCPKPALPQPIFYCPLPGFHWIRGPASPLTSSPPSRSTGSAPSTWPTASPAPCTSFCRRRT